MSSTTKTAMHVLLHVFVAAVGTHASTILPRGPQTNATCGAAYSWMDNGEGLSPCLVAAYVISACGTGNFGVYALPNNSHYDEPGVGGDLVNACSCSWAGYNTLAACESCQGNEVDIYGWAPWKRNCGDMVSNTTYFPFDQDYTIGTTLPYWAGQNPLTAWKDGRFDTIEAKALHDAGHNDLNGTETTGSGSGSSSGSDNDDKDDGGSSTPVGPIVGGVIGGVVVIGLAIFAAWWLLRRHRRQAVQAKTESNYDLNFPKGMHSRSISDFTTPSNTYGNLSMTMGPSSPGLTTSSVQGSGASYFGSVHGTSVFMSPPTSPAPMMMHTTPVGPQDVIVPFTATHSPNQSLSTNDRKDAMSFTTYDSPNAGPVHMDDSFSTAGDSTPSRRRFNPPAYTPPIQQRLDDSVSSGSTPGHRAGEKSQDSTLSYASTAPVRQMSIQNPSPHPHSPEPGMREFGVRNSSRAGAFDEEEEEHALGVDRPSSSMQRNNDADFDVSRLA